MHYELWPLTASVHLQHHLNSKTHWTQLPVKFTETLPKLSEHQGGALPPVKLAHSVQLKCDSLTSPLSDIKRKACRSCS